MMTILNYTVNFKKTVLSSFIGLSICQSCFALEALSDDHLSETTGEGIAILPQDAYMVFRGSGNGNENATDLLADRSNDIGNIHFLPVGPLSQTALNGGVKWTSGGVTKTHSVGKADLYLYGLALSKADSDPNSRLASTAAAAKITSWGTAENPWLLKVGTQNNVPNFDPKAAACTSTSANCQVPFLALEAPLYDKVVPTDPAKGADAYHLKLATWADAFVLDQSKSPTDPNLYALGETAGSSDANRANRLRIQLIWNDFSMNGSRIQLFQTLGGASNSNGMSTFYNNTLGMSGVLRFNTGDSSNVKATIKTTQNKGASTETMVNDGSTYKVNGVATSCGNSSQSSAPAYGQAGCQYQVKKITRTDTSTSTWTAPSLTKVLRLSTRETSDTPLLTSPAFSGGTAPTFDPNEGLFLYNTNVNLVLGSTYQPLTLGSDGKNFTIELARIPNKPEVYTQIYTRYAGDTGDSGVVYRGSTCNVYQCGTSGIAGYQGNNAPLPTSATSGTYYNATHSSISIGSTNYDSTNNILTAYSGPDAIGVSFGALTSTTNTVTANYLDLQQRYRAQRDRTWYWNCGSFWGACSSKVVSDWVYQSDTGGTLSTLDPVNVSTACNGTTSIGGCKGDTPPADSALLPSVTNRTWNSSNAIWTSANSTAQSLAGNPTINAAPSNVTISAPVNMPSNNFGSAVIDGLLIQHMKITTKGL